MSIITVVFNGEKYLEHAILSVLGQSYDNVEYVILDGGSVDGTLDILTRYGDAIDYWVSEHDEGIADAWNKGLSIARGDILGILNSDDWYEPDTVERVVSILVADSATGVVHGNLRQWDERGIRVKGVVQPAHKMADRFPYAMPVNHPTCFVRRKVYQEHGVFRTCYRSAMDYEFIARLLRSEVHFAYSESVLANMRAGGISCGARGLKESKQISILYGVHRGTAQLYYFVRLFIYSCSRLAEALKIRGFIGRFYRMVNRRYL